MVFSSYLFVFYFLPAVLLAYFAAPTKARNLVLTLLSYFFYGWANPLFVFIMLFSTVVDYVCGLVISKNSLHTDNEQPMAVEKQVRLNRRRKIAVVVSICSNLSLLGFFKYFNFALENYQSLLELAGLPWLSLDLAFKVTLPLGISFYTFQSMSYTIDVYRGKATVLRNFIDFACYVSMFPQLVAGPIIRFSEVARQLHGRRHTAEKFARGVAFLSIGLAKKILLANPCGAIADTVFDAGSRNIAEAWCGSASYAFQIYFDFSGYSDMAVGLGLMLGFVFPKNFDSPYRSASVTEFWRRWHISLSTWLRDYLYIPLGGNRKGPGRTYVNLIVVMLLGGLWHGAAWNFLAWGGIHGSLLAIERLYGKRPFYDRLPRSLKTALTFVVLLLTWVFFRADSLQEAFTYYGNMFGLGTVQEGAFLLRGVLCNPYNVGSLFLAGVITWCCPAAWTWTERITWSKLTVVIVLLWLSISVMTTQAYNPFIYFMF